MSSELGAFVLKQLLNATAIMGPLFLLVGFSFYIFKMGRRSIIIYLSIGVLFSIVGLWALADDLREARDYEIRLAKEARQQIAPEPARK